MLPPEPLLVILVNLPPSILPGLDFLAFRFLLRLGKVSPLAQRKI